MRPSRPSRALLPPSHSLIPRSQCRPHLQQQHRPQSSRPFSASPSSPQKRKPAHKSLSVKELQRIESARASSLKSYSQADKTELAKRYTPEQMAAIEAGERAIDPKHIATQGRTRDDIFSIKYLDDFAKLRPAIDKSVERLRGDGMDYAEVMAKSDEWKAAPYEERDLKKVMNVLLNPSVPDGPDDIEAARREGIQPGEVMPLDKLFSGEAADADGFHISDTLRRQIEDSEPKPFGQEHNIDGDEYAADARARWLATEGTKVPSKDAAKPQKTAFQRLQDALYKPRPSPHVAPNIPRIDQPGVVWDDVTELDDRAPDDETAIAFVRLAKTLGQEVRQIRQYRFKILVRHRVVNQTRLGKIQTIYSLAVAGNEDGMVGIGEGKSVEFDESERQARLNAIRNMVPVRRYESRTILGQVEGKCGAVELRLQAKPPGFGLRCSSHIFEIAKCAGITDLSAKITRSRNPMNVCKAVWEALKLQKDPEDVARGRGKKMVDVRKVYYAGLV